MLDQLRLPEELGQRAGPEPDLLELLGTVRRRRIDDPLARMPPSTESAAESGSTARTSRRARGLTRSPAGQLAQREAEHLFHPDIVA